MKTLVEVKIVKNRVFLKDVYGSEEGCCIHGVKNYYTCSKCEKFVKTHPKKEKN